METPKTPLPVTCQREKKIGKGAREQTEDFWDAEGSIKAKLAAVMPLRRTEDIPKIPKVRDKQKPRQRVENLRLFLLLHSLP